MVESTDIYDCIIIGGGPGGLTAGIYLARFRCNVLIIDDNKSRAALIPCSHNFPTFPQGISGKEILVRLKIQYESYQTLIVKAYVNKIEYNPDLKLFTVSASGLRKLAKTIILATGVVDIEPSLPNLNNGILKGLIRHCVICDGYEVIGKKIAIISDSNAGIMEALFLRNYSDKITLFNIEKNFKIPAKIKRKFNKLKIEIFSDCIDEVILENNSIVAFKIAEKTYFFDSLYSALGCKIRSSLAIELGAKHTDHFLKTNKNQETSVKGLYAIGDVVKGLNQMCVAFSHAAIAATAIFKKLKKLD